MPTTCTDLAKIDGAAWPRSIAWHDLRVATDLETAADAYWSAQQAVDAAKDEVKAAQARFRTARDALQQAIIASARDGVRMRDLSFETGLSREWIRQLLRAHGIAPD